MTTLCSIDDQRETGFAVFCSVYFFVCLLCISFEQASLFVKCYLLCFIQINVNSLYMYI